MFHPCTGRVVRLLAVLVLGGSASAQFTPLSGNVHDGNGGPLVAGPVYHAVNHITVPAGTTLTVQAGTRLKFGSGLQLVVDGTLNLTGTSVLPVIFTSVNDDGTGGDSNQNGPSSGAPGDWYGLVFNSASDASVIDHLDLLFAGSTFYGNAAVTLSNADITIRDSVIRGSGFAALDLTNSSSPAVRETTFHSNGGRAIENAKLRAVPGFEDNNAFGNAGGNSMRIIDANLMSDLSILAGNCLEGALVLADNVTVPLGTTLTLGSGVVFKFAGPLAMGVSGTLNTGGGITFPVVLTSIGDDTVVGDTNNNGPSTGAPGDWVGLTLNSTSDASNLYGLEVRHAGWSGYALAGITLSQSNATLSHTVVRDCAYAGLDLSNNSFPTVDICLFLDNSGVAVRNAPIEAVAGFVGTSALGNAAGNYIDVPGDATVSSDLTITRANCMGNPLVIGNNFAVASGVTLTLQQGVILKVRIAALGEVHGTLHVNGVAGDSVVITSFGDDSAGGDTNVNGPSSGAPGDWVGLIFRPSSDASYDNHLEVRHAGWSGYALAGITLDQADVQLADCTIRDCAYAALDLSSFGGAGSRPTVTRCSFQNNGGLAIDNAMLEAVPGFLGNMATGNAGGNYMEVTDPTPGSDVTISPANCLNGALVFNTHATVPPGVRVTMLPGVVVKQRTSLAVQVFGSLDLLGTAAHPVVLTSFRDDAFAGDTNLDGASVGVPGDWESLRLETTAGACRLEHVRLRYGGAIYANPLVHSGSPLATLRSVRAEHGLGGGISASAHAGKAANWVAFGCGGVGIAVSGGSFDVVHATSAGNGGAGINNPGSWTGQVQNSIAWSNGGGNYVGFGAAQLLACNGSAAHAGSNGNMNANPLFAGQATGDLALTAASPCIDTAAFGPARALIKDHREAPRILDHDLNGLAGADMGAYERSAYELAFSGAPQAGTTMSFTVQGSAPGVAAFHLGFLSGSTYVPPFGWSLYGPLGASTLLGSALVGQALQVAMPPGTATLGVEFGVQGLAFPSVSSPAGLYKSLVGSFTNLYRARVLP